MNKPTVGQILYSLNVGNAARNREQKLTKVTVSKVGSKYFTCETENGFDTKYNIDTWGEISDCIAGSCLYETEQEYLDEKLSNELFRVIKDAFSGYTNSIFSLAQLHRINEIIKESK